MAFKSVLVLFAVLGAGSAWADLKPDIIDCNPKKAARNAAMHATVGVSGRCDTGKVVENTKENVVDDAKDTVDKVTDIKPTPLDNDKGKLRPNKD
jgi:hypothetical protein